MKATKRKLDAIMDALEDGTGVTWKIYDCHEKGGCYEISTYSPAGENVLITIRGATFDALANDAKEARECFDAEEHAAQILTAKRTGDENARRFYASAPDSLRALLEDAEAIDGMYVKLISALEKAA